MIIEAVYGIVLLVFSSFCFLIWRQLIKVNHSPQVWAIAFAALFFAVAGGGLVVDSCRTDLREREAKIALEHKGHEALHARIKSELMSAEPGDILEVPNLTRMIIMFKRRSDGSISARRVYASTETNTFFVDRLVLEHARVLKLGTPEYATALVEEMEKDFGGLRRDPRVK